MKAPNSPTHQLVDELAQSVTPMAVFNQSVTG